MTEPFVRLTAVAAPLPRDNIDTDAIIPSREKTRTGRTGLAAGLFAGWRYLHGRVPDPGFVLNRPEYADARILLAGANFGCGSSREHAAWALAEYGFRAVIAPSFNPIFAANCARNGIVAVVLPASAVGAVADRVAADPPRTDVTVDLVAMVVEVAELRWGFALDAEARAMLLEGLDAIDLTTRHAPAIAAWRDADAARRPWVYRRTSGGPIAPTPPPPAAAAAGRRSLRAPRP